MLEAVFCTGELDQPRGDRRRQCEVRAILVPGVAALVVACPRGSVRARGPVSWRDLPLS